MSKSILIADDNDPERRTLRTVLEHAQFTVCAEAVDGPEAVDRASELKPDLIILDFRLPGLTGIEAACILRGRLPKTPIVLFTMYDVNPALVRAAGINAVVRKEDGINKLTACVRTLLTSQVGSVCN